jgi:hypothetical protein
MKSTTWLAVLRMILSAFGAYWLGKNLFGHNINEALWQEIVGGMMIAISVVMTILDKSSTYEVVEGIIRQAITSIGGVLAGLGIITVEALATWSGIILALLPLLLSLVGKKKSQAIAIGDLGVKDLSGVKEIAKKGESIAPVVNTPK